MKMLVVKLLLGAFIVAELQYGTMGGRVTSILDFGALILCKTERNPLTFNGYGCYCGFGGQGTPVDGLDRCCQVHDNCYGQLQRNFSTLPYAIYFTPYAINHLTCTCSTRQLTEFQRGLCRCDEQAAACFNRNYYNSRYSGYDKSKC
ncbi:basic phospholipase A2 taipoxin alpha chain-like [Montipora foliosa]|uniref:basic phospholipase A2 taipoxin alpha chain-like n=1 Tax=Montipora foliosa TaxID=591990 RepID=UPI0035F179FA